MASGGTEDSPTNSTILKYENREGNFLTNFHCLNVFKGIPIPVDIGVHGGEDQNWIVMDSDGLMYVIAARRRRGKHDSE